MPLVDYCTIRFRLQPQNIGLPPSPPAEIQPPVSIPAPETIPLPAGIPAPASIPPPETIPPPASIPLPTVIPLPTDIPLPAGIPAPASIPAPETIPPPASIPPPSQLLQSESRGDRLLGDTYFFWARSGGKEIDLSEIPFRERLSLRINRLNDSHSPVLNHN